MKDIMSNINQNIDRVELGPGNPSDSTQQETLSGVYHNMRDLGLRRDISCL